MELNQDLKLACVRCTAVLEKNDSQRFQGFTNGMGVQRVLDGVQRIHEEVVNNGISWQRGNVMNF